MERRETERNRRGAIDGVISTSALELGVDIGGLDFAVLNGYPARSPPPGSVSDAPAAGRSHVASSSA
jgi:ATP-dependent helicase YprA (DUF1998 family)